MSELRHRMTSSKDICASHAGQGKTNLKMDDHKDHGHDNDNDEGKDSDFLMPLINVEERSQCHIEPEVSVSSPREVSKLGLFSGIGMAIVAFQICCEVLKQLSNFSLQYYNGGRFPIPQTTIVIIVALMKLFATVVRAGGRCPFVNQGISLGTFRNSLRFLVPAILYGINNNVYFLGLTLVSPPIWLILCSFRTIITASTYKFVLKRPITRGQFLGCIVIVISLVVAKLPDLLQIINDRQDSSVIKIVAEMGSTNSTDAESSVNAMPTEENTDPSEATSINSVPLLAIGLAIVASCNSVGAALYTEHLFKSSTVIGETFLDQQFWMYLYESAIALLLHTITNPSYLFTSLTESLIGMTPSLQMVLFVAIMCGSIGGIVVASILKLLDNVVKEYSGSTANILTAILCSILFPDKFELTPYIILSMGCLLSGIYLYESQKLKPNNSMDPSTNKQSLNTTKG